MLVCKYFRIQGWYCGEIDVLQTPFMRRVSTNNYIRIKINISQIFIANFLTLFRVDVSDAI